MLSPLGGARPFVASPPATCVSPFPHGLPGGVCGVGERQLPLAPAGQEGCPSSASALCGVSQRSLRSRSGGCARVCSSGAWCEQVGRLGGWWCSRVRAINDPIKRVHEGHEVDEEDTGEGEGEDNHGGQARGAM